MMKTRHLAPSSPVRSASRAARFAAVAALLLASLAPVPSAADPSASQSPTPIVIGAPLPGSPESSPSSYAATHVIEPLHEIGHVKAATPFCKKFIASAGPAVNSALAYEAHLLQTVRDFRGAGLRDEILRQHSLRALESDLRFLASDANTGRAELAGVVALANESDQDQHDDLIAFRDALDGAKAQQMQMARRIARQVGRYAEMPTYNLVNTENDQGSSALSRSSHDLGNGSSYVEDHFADAKIESDLLEQQNELFGAFAGDDFIEGDLANAARHGKAVIDLAHC